ncbi:MAG: hypothetical protein M1818_000559 [Claussenomyces sp. TS43310]|nr:MAG: hypothetical protein M1818_000559 [Claussenomyces sp. TS43310]
MAPEECLCRRSNLYATLTTPGPGNAAESNYPIPQTGGIYSPFVVVFRSGPERYQVWEEFEVLPVISVAPVKRPKLDPSARAYSFAQEKELMKEKMRTALRIAAWYDFADVCLGSWGCGPHFRNPTREVASMWRDVLFFEDEFEGQFRNVVFAFDGAESGGGGSGGGGGGGGSSTSGSSKSSAKVSSSKATSSKSSAKADMEVFLDVFNPSKVFKKASK